MTGVGRDVNWAGLEKGEEKLFLTHLLYFQPLQGREYHVCFNLLTEILFSSVCRKSSRLCSVTAWFVFLNVPSSDRTTVNDISELSSLCPCPELLFTFLFGFGFFCVSEHLPAPCLRSSSPGQSGALPQRAADSRLICRLLRRARARCLY